MSEHQKSPGRGLPPATPRWVKLFVIIFIVLFLLVIALHVMGFRFGTHGVGGALPGNLVFYMLPLEYVVYPL
jgi:hypothetical protein